MTSCLVPRYRGTVLVVLGIATVEGCRAEACGLFGFVGDFVCIEGLEGEVGGGLWRSTFTFASASSQDFYSAWRGLRYVNGIEVGRLVGFITSHLRIICVSN